MIVFTVYSGQEGAPAHRLQAVKEKLANVFDNHTVIFPHEIDVAFFVDRGSHQRCSIKKEAATRGVL